MLKLLLTQKKPHSAQASCSSAIVSFLLSPFSPSMLITGISIWSTENLVISKYLTDEPASPIWLKDRPGSNIYSIGKGMVSRSKYREPVRMWCLIFFISFQIFFFSFLNLVVLLPCFFFPDNLLWVLNSKENDAIMSAKCAGIDLQSRNCSLPPIGLLYTCIIVVQTYLFILILCPCCYFKRQVEADASPLVPVGGVQFRWQSLVYDPSWVWGGSWVSHNGGDGRSWKICRWIAPFTEEFNRMKSNSKIWMYFTWRFWLSYSKFLQD